MKLIFCISNLFIPATISLVEQEKDQQFLIYIDQQGILDFFAALNLSNVSLYLQDELSFSIKKPLSIYRYLRKRKATYAFLKKSLIKEIIFFHNTFGSTENWLIQKFSPNCVVLFYPIFNELPFKVKYSSKTFVQIILSNLIYKVNIESLWTGERYIFRTLNSFFVKINAKKIEISIDNNSIGNLVSDRVKLNTNKKIVLLTGTIVELGQVDKNEYTSKIDEIIKMIGKEKIFAKPHPRFPNRYSLENDLELIPAFIPANVLFTKFDIFIGYSTTVLTEAANNGLIAISLLDYLKPVSEERRIKYKEYLKTNLRNKNTIFFPEDFEKLNGLIIQNSLPND